ncbi:MAG: TonB-dependent receptor [Bryobacteraceae bacterium]|nr:TonB-dependent receptor [Bryobacteraceae bacterium]
MFLLLYAQVSSSSGQVQGQVSDASGAALAGATIVLRNPGTAAQRQTETGADGQFRFSAVPIGEYALEVKAAGMAVYKIENFIVSVGQTINQRVVMTPAGVNEKLEVTAEAEGLQTTATTSSVALGYDRVEETPSQNRNYLSFVFAAPGMSPSAGANTQRAAAGMHNVANDSGFVFAGMRGRNNSISIDGADNRDETTGGNRVAIGLEMVQEFRVAGTSVSVEFGGAAGGMVNLVTRSGVNLWHGDITMFLQNEALSARNAEVTSGNKQRYRRYQPGVSLLGPLRKDKTFFAAAVESAWERGEEWSETGLGLRARLERVKPVTLTSGLYPEAGHDTESSFKLNHILSNRHQVSSRYAFSQGRVTNDVIGVENFSDLSARGSSLLRDHSLVTALSSALSPTKVNDLRFQFGQRQATITPNARGPMIEIPGVLTFGGAYRLDQSRTENHFELADSFSESVGKHILTLGGSVHAVRLDARLANRFAGLYVFPTLADFEAGRPDVFSQAFGDPRTRLNTTPVGLWLQDRWQARTGLTIEAGLRFDRQTMPAGLPPSSNNFAPRVGLAWHVGAKSPWVIRAGAGLFYDRYPLAFLNDAVQKDGRQGFEQYATGAAARQIWNQTLGGVATQAFSFLPNASYRAASHFPSTYSTRFTAGVERALNAVTTVSLEGTFARGVNLPRIRNVGEYLLEQTARSRYQGATLTVNRRMSREVTYLVSYTAARTFDDASDFDEQPHNPSNLRPEWALSKQHQLHRFSGSALFELPSVPGLLKDWLEGLTLAPIYSFGSGRPLNALDSTDTQRTGAYPVAARPFGLGRNPFYGPAIRSLDLRVFKFIPVFEGRAKWNVGVEAFNVLNHTNSLRVSPFYAAQGARLANYRSPIEVMIARQVQLFATLEW